MRTVTIFLTAAFALAVAQGQDVRYTDDINGFSLIPPSGAIQTKVDEASVLAQWVKIDPKTSNTEWAFSVSRWVADVVGPGGKKLKDSDYSAMKMSSFVDSIMTDIKDQPGLQVLSKQEITIVAHPAIVIECSDTSAGSAAANVENRRWMKQAWVKVTPRMFLTFKIVAREKFKKQAQTVWQMVMSRLNITDDKSGSTRQQEKVLNAEKFISLVAREKLQNVFMKEAEWFLISQDGTTVGWLCMGAKPRIFLDSKGSEFRSYAMIKIPGKPVKLIYQQMFVSEDLKVEQWRSWMQIDDGDNAQLMAEDGFVQDNRILCETNSTAQGTNKQVFNLPDIATNMYLPKAIGAVIASRLSDMTDSGYIFAEYDSGRNNLAMREITVVGPDELETANGPVKVIKIIETTDRANKPTSYWVTPQRQILKIQNPVGTVMTAANRELVAKYYPNAPAMIDAIRTASLKKWKEGNNR